MAKTIYEITGKMVGKLVTEKQEAYGNSFELAGKILKELYPNGVMLEQYTDMLVIARIIDKLFRIANSKNAFGESPYQDIAGYGILGVIKDGKNGEVKQRKDKIK